jgi:ribonuclease D
MENFQICDRDLTPEICDRYRAASALAVDTETMGLIPGRDRLCLVQICDPSGFVAVLRVAKGQTEAPVLKSLMEDPNIEKIFHFARFDVAQLRQAFGIETRPIFCTKIASKLARTYTSNHGLKSLVLELEAIELNKTAQSSDWGNALNLSDEQLSYAANDVRYLIGLRDKLTVMLQREDRWELARRCFEVIPTFCELDLNLYQGIFEH